MQSLVTFDFLKLAIQTIFSGTDAVFSTSPTGGSGLNFQDSNGLNGTFQYDETNGTCTWKTSGSPVYSVEPTSSVTVNCINIGKMKSANGVSLLTSYYSLPLGQTVTVNNGSQIKINPYKENSSGEHTRGIRVIFKLEDTN